MTAEPTPEEREAVVLRWRSRHPNAPEGSAPTDEEAAALLVEIREIEAAIKARALSALRRATRNPASYSHNSKHVPVFSYFIFVLVGVGVDVTIVQMIVHALGR